MIFIDSRKLARDIHTLLRNSLFYTPTGRIIAETLTETTKDHVAKKYPNSTHWALDKINEGGSGTDWGSVEIDVDGADRAYNTVTILPNGQYLTIPVHQSAMGKRAKDIEDLFKPKGKNILAKVMGGKLVAMFALVKRVFQRQDDTMLPKDETFAHNISDRWITAFFNKLDENSK